MAANHPGNAGAAQLEAERLYYKCDAIAEDEAALRQKYQSDPGVLKTLDFVILPADVDDLLHRRTGCNELTKAASKHPKPTNEREPARLYLKCNSLANDEAALRTKYTRRTRP